MSAESAAKALAQLGDHGATHENANATAMHAARVAYENWDRSNFGSIHYGHQIAGQLKIGLHHIGAKAP